MIVRARRLISMDQPVIDNGAVAISGDRITAVGTFEHVKQASSGQIIDLADQLLLPGLVNAHCHLDYTRLRSRIVPQKSFTQWILVINAEKEKLSPQDYTTSIDAGIAEAQKFGTTSIVNFEAFPELAAAITSSIRIWWLAELIDVRASESTADLVNRAAQDLNSTPNRGLAPHAPFTASRSLYQMCAHQAHGTNGILSSHVAESHEEMMMFRDGAGPLFEFLQSIGRDMNDCGSQTPLENFVSTVAAARVPADQRDLSRWIIAHLNELTETDFELLSGISSKFHIAHCPRSHRYFGHTRFEFERLRKLGYNVCLGTDSLASNDDLSLFAEMREFQRNHPDVDPHHILEMVTVNPARALHQDGVLGRICNGSNADLIAIDDRPSSDAYECAISHQSAVNWAMSGGTILAA